MKICFIVGTLSYSGAEKILYNMTQKLKERGHDISILLLSCSETNDNISGISQYPLFDIKEESKNKFIRVGLRIKRIRRVLKSNDFDLIVSFGMKFNLDSILSTMFLKTPIILCERNDPQNDPKSRILAFRRFLTYRFAQGFVFQTDEIKSYFSNSIQRKSTVIPNFIEKNVGVDNLYNPQKKSFSTVGRLDDNQKDQSNLIKAFSIFNEEYKDYTLEIYGEGPDRDKYEKLIQKLNISDKVFLKGRVKNPMNFIKNSEAFILSSKFEGMPNALIESLAQGIPSIATNCSGGGAKYLIENEVNGLLVPVGDEKQLSDAMKKIIQKKKTREEIIKNSNNINQKLEINRIVEMWETYFREIINKNSKK